MNDEIISEEEVSPPLADNVSEEADLTAKEKTPQEAEADTISRLNGEIQALKEELLKINEEKAQQERALGEIKEFSALFPTVSLDSIPEHVWEQVRKGGSLAAYYALHERRLLAEQERIASINMENASKSAGKAGVKTAEEYFSPDEVKRMTPAEVHANYSKIKKSMKKWI